MNCIREAENYLRYYRELNQSLGHADRMIKQLKKHGAPREVGAVNMDVTGIRAGRPVNTLNQMYQLQKWQEIKDRTYEEIVKVEESLQGICNKKGREVYRDILFMWYVEEMDKEEIAVKVGYTSRHLRRVKKLAIRRFAIALFGVMALEAV